MANIVNMEGKARKERGSSKIEKTRINRAINGNGKLDNSEGPE